MEYLDLLQCPATRSPLADELTEGDRDIPVRGALITDNGTRYSVANEVVCLMPEKDSAIRSYWAKQESFVARLEDFEADYDNAIADHVRDIYAQWEADLASAILGLEVAEVVVDAACGQGGFLRRFLGTGEFEGIIVACDRSRPRLNWLRNKIASELPQDAEFVRYIVADPRMLPFRADDEDEGVDVILGSSGFVNVPNPGRLLSHVRSKLIDGGAFVGRFMWFEAGSQSHQLASDHGINFLTRGETVNALKGAGFADVQVHVSHSGDDVSHPFDALPMPGDHVELAVVTAIR